MWLCLNGACGTINPDTANTCTVCGGSGLQVRLFNAGTMIGAYEIRRFVGHGGYGVVYEATLREESGAVVDIALKQTSLADYRALERELNLLKQVSHPALPIYYEAFQHGGAGYLAMEFVQGLNLRELLTHAGGALGEKQVLQYAQELCGAVAALHAQRPPLLHRDIKPANIRLTPAGRIKLVDFGLTKAGNEATRTTQQGATLGYAPWEQLTATSKTDERSDIYSIGATLYHLLTNQIPASSLERGIEGKDTLIPPEQLNPALHSDVVKIVRKAMERKQAARYQNIAELQAALRRLITPVATQSAPIILQREPFRLPMVWILLALAIALGALALGINQIAGVTNSETPTIIAVATSANTPTTSTAATQAGGVVVGGDETPTPSVAEASVTAIATSTEAASPTATAEPPTATPPPPPETALFSVAAIANGTSDFDTPPQGQVELGGVLFDVSSAIFKSQADADPFRIAPTEARITTDITGATRLYLLLNTGNGRPEYEGETVGAIFATCDGSEVRLLDLVLGQNIREWHSDENVVGTATDVQEVFEGGRLDNVERRGHIDMLTIDLPDACRGSLTAITLRDISVDTVGSLDPAINWTGVSVEYQP